MSSSPLVICIMDSTRSSGRRASRMIDASDAWPGSSCWAHLRSYWVHLCGASSRVRVWGEKLGEEVLTSQVEPSAATSASAHHDRPLTAHGLSMGASARDSVRDLAGLGGLRWRTSLNMVKNLWSKV